MKHLSFIAVAFIAIFMAGCSGNGTTSASKASTDSTGLGDTTSLDSANQMPSQEVVDELSKAVTEEHADASAQYKYDPKTNTVTMVKEVELKAGQKEEDFDVATEFQKFVDEFKKSTKSSDATIKSKGATITVKYVNKATGEEFMSFDITPDDLK